MIFEEAGSPGTGPGKGAVFVSDGMAALNKNHLYYEDDSGTLYDLLSGAEGSATIKHAFAFNSASPIDVTPLSAGDTVIECFLKFTQAFDDPAATVSVGTVANPNIYMAPADSDPSVAGAVYESCPVEELTAPEELTLTISPGTSTQGQGFLVAVIHRVSSVPSSSTQTLATAGVVLQKGDVLTAYWDIPNSEVRVKKADADAADAEDRNIFGIAGHAAIAGDEVTVSTIPGVNTLVNFDVAPVASDIGKMVYLSTTAGEASLSSPTVSGSSVWRVGFLYQETSASGLPVVTLQQAFVAEVP